MKMQAKVPFTYGGKRLAVGDDFTASRQDGRALELLGRAMQAAEVADESDEDKPAKKAKKAKKRAYKRRDMQAEE